MRLSFAQLAAPAWARGSGWRRTGSLRPAPDTKARILLGLAAAALTASGPAVAQELESGIWMADQGDGTYRNPVLAGDYSDPDVVRVGEDYYLTASSFTNAPGLPILHSRDLVNWHFVAYACDRLDLGPAYRLEDGKAIYGQGIWAPTLRWRDGTFYIFTNVNGQTTQIFRATDPKGPWTHRAMKKSLHDLSVLFDDDGKVWVVWGYQTLHIAQLTDDLTDIVPGTEREAFKRDAGMGEGSHFYKINGKYYIITAWFAGRMKIPAARADRIDGPWEVNRAIAFDEDFGLLDGVTHVTPEGYLRLTPHRAGTDGFFAAVLERSSYTP